MIWNDAGMAETGKRWSDHPKHKRNKIREGRFVLAGTEVLNDME
jgi:hypothetical protein